MKRGRRPLPSLLPQLRDLGRLPLAQLRTAAGIAKLAAQQALERAGITRKAVSLQFATAHDTPMTGSATPGRAIATTTLPLAAVKAACRASRATLNHVALATELIDKVGLSDRIPATGHTLISNVPGSPHDLYLKGARLLQNYPLSILVPGLRSNITMFSCSGSLNFGIVATRDLVHLDRLAGAIPEEFANFQQALGLA